MLYFYLALLIMHWMASALFLPGAIDNALDGPICADNRDVSSTTKILNKIFLFELIKKNY